MWIAFVIGVLVIAYAWRVWHHMNHPDLPHRGCFGCWVGRDHSQEHRLWVSSNREKAQKLAAGLKMLRRLK